MAKYKEQNQAEELEKYLSTSLNHLIYYRLTKGDRIGLFEPLEFFNQLYGLRSDAIVHKCEPSTLVERINEIELNDKQKSFLLYYLDLLLFENEVITCLPRLGGEKPFEPRMEGLSLVGGAIQEEWTKLNNGIAGLAGTDWVLAQEGVDPNIVKNHGVLLIERLMKGVRDRYSFYRVKHHLETLPDYKTKIAYLVEIKTEYLHQSTNIQSKFKGFDQQCDREIEKLEKLTSLWRSSKATDEEQTEDTAITRNPEFTTARQVLAILFLLEYAKALEVPHTEKARFIEFLTGKNYNNIYKKVLSPLKSRDRADNQDLVYVADWFRRLGLLEIVKDIENGIKM